MKILKFFINYIYIALGVVVFSFSYNFAFAQEVDLSPLLDKLNLLERDIRDLQRQVNTGETPPQDMQTIETNNIAPKAENAADLSPVTKLTIKKNNTGANTGNKEGIIISLIADLVNKSTALL